MSENSKGAMFPTCMTKSGDIISAYEAKRGEMYNCFDQTCSCEVFKKESPNGLPFMSTRRGQRHTGNTCSQMVQRKYGRDLESTYFGGLEKAILRPPHQNTQPETDDIENEGKTDLIKRPKRPRSEGKSTRSIRGLEELERFGITKKENRLLFGKTKTIDLFVSERNAHLIMGSSNERCKDLGPRGLEVRPEYAFDKARTLRFMLYGEPPGFYNYYPRCMVIDMEFDTQDEYESAREMLFFANTNPASKIRYCPKFASTVYVYGVWVATLDCRSYCRRWCTNVYQCIGRLTAQGINHKTQIYVPTHNC